ncbi:MAG: class I SAM-dependent methyltransferase [Clostridiales bacterium]|uniref:class I SAM-dependent methyltransferase n=1 Tax=Flavonifractor porci TaxID=3133422 RepID=UPI003097DE33|nr:class I SAM-dependent methyltransferase [Clostridiales bacterium]
MRIKWNNQTVRWFEDAAEYTGYNKKLAQILKKYIPEGETLCDLGCGAGLVDLALADHCSAITCVDIAPGAVEHVRRKASTQGIENIHTLCMDAAELTGSWDNVMAIFFGGSQIYDDYFHLAGKRFVLITNAQCKGNFGPEGHQTIKCFNIATTKAYLDSIGVKYVHEALVLEYGQPLTDIEDARTFVRTYTRPMSDEMLEAYLEEKLEKTGDEKWPYYLPNRKEFGLFIIERDENEKLPG